ncbi:MAG: hypothetical protein CSA33_08275 [Desulfobulbus propionicus]|nr:MAG: hypothetical protein CSA33_08275 [Desulfobulbus propionicus]
MDSLFADRLLDVPPSFIPETEKVTLKVTLDHSLIFFVGGGLSSNCSLNHKPRPWPERTLFAPKDHFCCFPPHGRSRSKKNLIQGLFYLSLFSG